MREQGLNFAFGVGVKEISDIYVLKVQTLGHSASKIWVICIYGKN